MTPDNDSLVQHPDVASNLALLKIWIQARMAYSGVPGTTVAIVHDQELVYAKGFGFADVEKEVLATPDTIFRIASHSKLFTAIAIMQLREADKLHLDEPLAHYLPWFKPQDSFPHSPTISLRQILTHTSGLPREAGSGYWIDYKFPSTVEVMERMPRLGRKIPSETRWKYSNLALTLAGEVVAAVSGLRFADYVQQNILDPLDMRSTSVVIPAAHRDRLATGYGPRWPGELIREALPFIDAAGLAAATGLSSTVNDMARFMSWQFRLRDADGREVLKANTLREMQRIHWLDKDWQQGWGLGFSIVHKKDRDLIGHGGGYPGYLTLTQISPKEKVGVAVFTNALGADPGMISERAFEWLAPAIQTAVKGEPGTQPDPGWAKFEGTYRDRWGDSHVIFVDGKLMLVDPTVPDPKAEPSSLEPDGENRFKLEGPGYGSPGEAVYFDLDDSGRAARIHIGDLWMDRTTY